MGFDVYMNVFTSLWVRCTVHILSDGQWMRGYKFCSTFTCLSRITVQECYGLNQRTPSNGTFASDDDLFPEMNYSKFSWRSVNHLIHCITKRQSFFESCELFPHQEFLQFSDPLTIFTKLILSITSLPTSSASGSPSKGFEPLNVPTIPANQHTWPGHCCLSCERGVRQDWSLQMRTSTRW